MSSIAADAKIERELLEKLMESLEENARLEEQIKISRVDFLSDIPIHLRQAAIRNVHQGVAESVLLFQNRDPSILAKMIPKMMPMRVEAGKPIYSKGQYASHVYILFSGRVALQNKVGLYLKEFVVGSYFGEYEVFSKIPRRHTLVAMEPTDLMLIEKNDFLELMNNYLDLKRDVLAVAVIREIQLKQTVKKVASLHS